MNKELSTWPTRVELRSYRGNAGRSSEAIGRQLEHQRVPKWHSRRCEHGSQKHWSYGSIAGERQRLLAGASPVSGVF
eukprot:5795225-Amphidinium_carterae.1